MGAVAPNGLGLDAYWDGLRHGRSGVRTIDRFDVSHLPTQIAGLVDGIEASDLLPTKEIKHLPRAVVMAIAAADEALRSAGIDAEALSLDDRRRFGSVIGTGGAGIAFTEQQFREFYHGNRKAVSLYSVPSSTPGGFSSELSMRYGLRGPSHVLSTGCTSSTDAIGHVLDGDAAAIELLAESRVVSLQGGLELRVPGSHQVGINRIEPQFRARLDQ